MSDRARVFVYGSLRRGQPYERYMQGAEFVCAARTTSAYQLVLYREGYPALTIRGDESDTGPGVCGELYLVSESHLERLDEFEECPELYQREAIELSEGTWAQAYVVSGAEGRKWPVIERWESAMTQRGWTGERP